MLTLSSISQFQSLPSDLSNYSGDEIYFYISQIDGSKKSYRITLGQLSSQLSSDIQ